MLAPKAKFTKRCPVCGAEIGRAKGHLRSFASWMDAVESMVARHIELVHRTSSSVTAPQSVAA